MALCLVIGANLGSGLLAMLNNSAANAAARRVALGSLLFKLVGSLIILPFVHLLAETMGKLPLPKAELVIYFHVFYNLVPVSYTHLVFVMTTSRASGQEIRPLKVLILNLMPKKSETENQFLRLLSNSPLQVDIQLLRIDSRESRNTPAEHLNNFYCNFEDIPEQNFDGLIVTGAPLGMVEFNDVAYWPQIKQVLEWSKDHVTSTLFRCV